MGTDLIGERANESAALPNLSAFEDEWYLNAYKASSLEGQSKWRRLLSSLSVGGWNWRKVAVAGMLGILAGLGIASRQIGSATPNGPQPAAAVQSARSALDVPSTPQLPATPTVPSGAPPVVASHKEPVVQRGDDVARLTTRNRRLEALVQVLRQRPVEKRNVQEQTTYLGQ